MPDLQGNPLNRGLTSDAKAKVNEPPQPHLSYLCEALSALQTLIILSENLVGRFRSDEQCEERAEREEDSRFPRFYLRRMFHRRRLPAMP